MASIQDQLQTTKKTVFLNLSNSTDVSTTIEDGPAPLWDTVALGGIGILSLIGNGTVIFLICTRRNLHKPASPNWFVLSLALADLCVSGLYAPSRFICRFATDCSVIAWNIIYYFQGVFLSSSVLNLCVLTFDRYLAVVHPFTYRNIMRSSRVFHLIQSAWWMAILLNIPYLVLAFIPQESHESLFVHGVSYVVLFASIPSAFMFYAYIAIVFVVRRHKNHIKRQERQLAMNFTLDSTGVSRNNNHHHKDETMKAVGIIVIIFIICSGLYQWLTICNLGGNCHMTMESPVYFVIYTLFHFRSAINFIVYALLRKDFQAELRKIAKRFHKCA